MACCPWEINVSLGATPRVAKNSQSLGHTHFQKASEVSLLQVPVPECDMRSASVVSMFRIHMVLKDDDLKIILKNIMLRPNGHVHAKAEVSAALLEPGIWLWRHPIPRRVCQVLSAVSHRGFHVSRTGPAFGFLS